MFANTSRGHRALWIAFGLLWLGGVVAGLGALAAYDNRPGEAARVRGEWPRASRIARAQDRSTLVMLAHPRWSCTRASVGELAELIGRARHRPKAYVVFIKPGGVGDDWEKTGLWQAASKIPDVTVLRDDNGVEADRFGAVTSGQTFLYDEHGHLLYSGGTTGSRGHPGDNVGRATILALLDRERAHPGRAAVFGCPLFALVAERPFEESTDHATQPN